MVCRTNGALQGVIQPSGIVVDHLIATDLESWAVTDEGDQSKLLENKAKFKKWNCEVQLEDEMKSLSP